MRICCCYAGMACSQKTLANPWQPSWQPSCKCTTEITAGLAQAAEFPGRLGLQLLIKDELACLHDFMVPGSSFTFDCYFLLGKKVPPAQQYTIIRLEQ